MKQARQPTIPPEVFCPKCGKKNFTKYLKDPIQLNGLTQQGYDEGGHIFCECGVYCAILHRPMPDHPTFTFLIDVYLVEPEKANKPDATPNLTGERIGNA